MTLDEFKQRLADIAKAEAEKLSAEDPRLASDDWASRKMAVEEYGSWLASVAKAEADEAKRFAADPVLAVKTRAYWQENGERVRRRIEEEYREWLADVAEAKVEEAKLFVVDPVLAAGVRSYRHEKEGQLQRALEKALRDNPLADREAVEEQLRGQQQSETLKELTVLYRKSHK